jgi:two-component system, OmpR family, alkaline phosphatase synthesis response regulator PhoP
VATPAPVAPPLPGLEAVIAELRSIRALQEQILGRLESRRAPEPPAVTFNLGDDSDDDAPSAPAPPPVRSRRRKTILLIDDDPSTTKDAVAALTAAEVPVRTVDDGNAALAAIAAEKPDVIAIELEMGGAMGGKDVINMIKATMEWVDVPIILYTRAAVASQKEARQIHGADELVLKQTEGPSVLVSRTIAIFRRP